MNSLIGWTFKTAREKKKMPENRLLQLAYLINCLPIRKRLDEMYRNKTEKGRRPNFDVIKMPHSLKLILGRQKKRVAMKPKLVTVEMVPGQRKETKPILATSFIRKPISIMV